MSEKTDLPDGVAQVVLSNGIVMANVTQALLDRGLAARTTCTAGSWMIPFGGNRVRLGTNPIAWGMPCGDENIIIDIATTQRAVSPAIRAVRGGFPIPPDYFKDKNLKDVKSSMRKGLKIPQKPAS